MSEYNKRTKQILVAMKRADDVLYQEKKRLQARINLIDHERLAILQSCSALQADLVRFGLEPELAGDQVELNPWGNEERMQNPYNSRFGNDEVDEDEDEVRSAHLGMTDRLRAFLRSHPGREFSPTEIRDALAATGYALKGRNPLAEIHQTLRRIVDAREGVSARKISDRKTLYKYDLPAAQADDADDQSAPKLKPGA